MCASTSSIGAGAKGTSLPSLVWRAFKIGARAEHLHQRFAAYTAQGLGLWIGMQAFINIGVNVGLLPTKGLTLPLMSYGGSSMISTMLAVGFLFAVDRQCRPVAGRSR